MAPLKMAVWTLLSLFLISGLTGLQGQTPVGKDNLVNITRLEENLSNASVSEKLVIYNELSKQYLPISPDRAAEYARKALDFAVILENRQEELSAHYWLGLALLETYEYHEALDHFGEALAIYRLMGNKVAVSDILLAAGKAWSALGDQPVAIQCLEESVEIEKEGGSPERLSDRFVELGDAYYADGQYLKSLESYQQGLDLETGIGRTQRTAVFLNKMGVVYFDLGNYEKALEYYLKSLNLMEELDDRQGIARAMNNIGLVYHEWGNNEKALEYYHRSLQIEEELGNIKGMGASYNNIGIIYSDWGQNELAIDYYQKSLEIDRRYRDITGIAQSLNNIGESYFELGEHEKALEYLMESLGMELEQNNRMGIAQSYQTISEIHYRLKDFPQAMSYLQKSMAISDSLKLIPVMMDNYKLMYLIQSDQNNHREALRSYLRYSSLKDSIYTADFHKKLADVQVAHEMELQDRQTRELREDNSQKEREIRMQRLYLFIIFSLMIVFAFLVYFDIRAKQRANKALQKKNDEILDQQRQLESALEKLSNSEKKYRNLVMNAPTGILYMDVRGNILEINRMLLEILGSPGETETRRINCMEFPPLVEAGVADDIRKCIKTRKTIFNEKPYTSKWGKKIYVRYYLTPVSNEENAVTHIIFNVEDFTDRKNAEQAQFESEKKYRHLVENFLQAMFVIRGGMLLFANARMTELAQYSPEDLYAEGADWLKKIVHPEDYALALEQIHGRMRRESSVEVTEVRFVRKDGEVRWVELLVSDMDWLDRPAVLAVAMDITSRKIAENILMESEMKLQEANAAKDKLFSIIAHDLRNPFNAITGFASLLYESYETLDEQTKRQYIRNIYDAADNTFRLLQNLLDWSLSQTGKLVFNPQVLDLTPIVRETVSYMLPSAERKNVRVGISLPKDIKVFADENMVRTVIRNLFSNAVKFTPPSGTVSIEYGMLDGRVQIRFTDTGIGIDPEDLDNLFRPDKQYKSSRTSGEQGSGLGLMLCKEFVEKNGGEITVESVKGQGSVFTFTLPLAPSS